MDQKLLTIGETAKILGISIDTLRRWDKNGRLKAIRVDPAGHRYYRREDIENLLKDLFALAKEWALSANAYEPPADFYCGNSAVFQARLISLQHRFSLIPDFKKIFPLIIAVAGEIGNNSFDHNLGQWPDTPGIFFGYDINKKYIVLADRGQGVLTTLKRVKPNLQNHQEALFSAFTEIISGRAPEARGNGLKFVKNVISNNPIKLFFQSGNAYVNFSPHDKFDVHVSDNFLRGCLALINI